MTEHRLRQELDQLLREDTKIFDFLESSTLDGMWFWDLENPEEEWMSETFWRTFGYDPSEKQHLASEWQDMINPDDLALALENFNAHCADPNHPYDQIVRYRHKDGSTVWVRCRGMAIRDESGKPIRMLGAHNNITGLKTLEESTLRQIEDENKILDHQNRVRERLERIANIGTWELEVETSGLYWSDQIKRIHEVPEDYVPTLESGISFYAPGESQSTITSAVEHAMSSGEGWDLVLQLITAKGNTIWVRAMGEVELEAGTCIRLFGTLQDITEQQRVLMQRQQLYAMTAHELRTPLAALSMMTNTSSQQEWWDSKPMFDRALQDVFNTLDDMRMLVNPDIKRPIRVETVDLPEFNASLSAICTSLTTLNSFQLEFSDELPADSGAHRYQFDAYRIRVAVVNLVKNACLHSQGNRIHLRSGIRPGDDGQETLFWDVIDNGVGIDERLLPRMFRPFARGGSTAEGTGMGLYIVKSWLAEIEGQLDYRRENGNSHFRITIPLERAAASAAESTISAPTTNGGGQLQSLRVLFVEDDPLLQKLGGKMLERLGLSFDIASDGEEAYSRYRQNYDLILTDFYMPKMTGLQLLTKVREEGYEGPVVILTAANLSDELSRLEGSGADEVLIKPINPQMLAELIARLVEQGKIPDRLSVES